MPNTYFQFKQFRIDQENCAMKVCTDACIFGAWYSRRISDAASVLDIGSGTGLLMMMLAQRSSALIHGIEIEPDCFEHLKKNISQNEWASRIKVFNGDVRGYTFPLQYDHIISNPPFYDNDLSSETEGRRLAMHSKELSLGELVNSIVRNLKSTGSTAILLPYHRAAAFNKIAEKNGLFLSEELRVKQTSKHDWFRFMGRYRFEKIETVKVEELVIKEGNVYTKEFVEMLRDYYLYL